MNICHKCDDSGQFSFDVADTGVCSHCHNISECWDIELLGFYREFGLTDEQIWATAPRLRHSMIPGSVCYTLPQIARLIAQEPNKPVDSPEK